MYAELTPITDVVNPTDKALQPYIVTNNTDVSQIIKDIRAKELTATNPNDFTTSTGVHIVRTLNAELMGTVRYELTHEGLTWTIIIHARRPHGSVSVEFYAPNGDDSGLSDLATALVDDTPEGE